MDSSQAVKYDGLDANYGSASLYSIDYWKLEECSRENVSRCPLIFIFFGLTLVLLQSLHNWK